MVCAAFPQSWKHGTNLKFERQSFWSLNVLEIFSTRGEVRKEKCVIPAQSSSSRSDPNLMDWNDGVRAKTGNYWVCPENTCIEISGQTTHVRQMPIFSLAALPVPVHFCETLCQSRARKCLCSPQSNIVFIVQHSWIQSLNYHGSVSCFFLLFPGILQFSGRARVHVHWVAVAWEWKKRICRGSSDE